jgi:hypothetical protein
MSPLVLLLLAPACHRDEATCDPAATPPGLSLGDLGDLERAAIDLINADRAFFQEESSGARALAANDALSEVARCHARDLCERSFFDHENPDGELVEDRTERVLGDTFGEDYWAIGENLALYSDGLLSGASDVATLAGTLMTAHHLGFMNECQCNEGCPSGLLAGHRMTLLHPIFDEVGVGEWYCEANDSFYSVQVFWRRSPPTSTAYPYCDGGFTADPPDPYSTAL